MTLIKSAKVARKKIKPWTPGHSNLVTGMIPMTSQLVLKATFSPHRESNVDLPTCIRTQIKCQPASSLNQEVIDLGMTVTFQIGLGYSWSNKATVCVEAEIMNYQSL